ncbi:MAG: rhodanese-like domain-containing protein [Myxococcales bacterium]|nr:rhodanese-like domain-containing protein [Myxococcales bacterium]
MRISSLALTLALALGATVTAGCSKDSAKPAAKAAPAEVSVDDLAKQLAAKAARPVDANGTKTRKDVGFIPGAVLLTDYETYAASELPADKAEPLVFYCANTQCGASHEAAAKAVAMGYKDVKVLPAGIMGWTEAGQRVEKL